MSACVLVAGATAPGTQASSEAMIAIGFLMPRRRASGVRPWISAASKATSAGCSGACRRSSVTVMCGSASISWRVKSACEPSISAAIMMEKPTPVATPATATSVWRTRKRTCVSAMSRTRFMAPAAPALGDARTRWPSRRLAGGRRGDALALARGPTGSRRCACRGCRSRPAAPRTRSPSMTNTRVPCTASAGTSSASGFSRVTTLASTLMPTCSGVSSGSAMRMR